jgi:hypothetical protein
VREIAAPDRLVDLITTDAQKRCSLVDGEDVGRVDHTRGPGPFASLIVVVAHIPLTTNWSRHSMESPGGLVSPALSPCRSAGSAFRIRTLGITLEKIARDRDLKNFRNGAPRATPHPAEVPYIAP